MKPGVEKNQYSWFLIIAAAVFLFVGCYIISAGGEAAAGWWELGRNAGVTLGSFITLLFGALLFVLGAIWLLRGAWERRYGPLPHTPEPLPTRPALIVTLAGLAIMLLGIGFMSISAP